MSIPIYTDAQQPETLSANAHHGLWFERFFDQYDEQKQWSILEPKQNQEQQGKSWWLKKYFKKKVGDDEQLSEYAHQQSALIASYEGKERVYTSHWHFVTGMGNSHPVENGFAWHHTLGVPYLTGAAVKGLVRSYIEQNLDDSAENKNALLLRWFGSNSKNPSYQGYKSETGAIVFFDAVPVTPVQLGVDIMTPHMGEWYAKGGKAGEVGKPENVPADWHAPKPIPFLVAKDISLQFGFALRPDVSGNTKADIDLDEVADVLQKVLSQYGAGAKTKTGYGAFQRDADLEKQVSKQRKQLLEDAKQIELEKREAEERTAMLAAMDPLEREIAEFETVLQAIKALTESQWEGDEAKKAAEFLKARMKRENIWKDETVAKKPHKDKPYQRTLSVMKFL